MARYFQTQGGTFDVSNKEGLWAFFTYCQNHPDDVEALQLLSYYLEVPAVANHYREWQQAQSYMNSIKEGEDPNQVQADAAAAGYTFDGTGEKVIDNAIAQSNAQQEQAYQTQMRDTSVTSTVKQLEDAGLAAGGVLSIGGAGSGVQSTAAATNMHSAAEMKQQARINAFNQKMGLTRSLVHMASSMASSGIYGAALGAVKNAGARFAASAAHSATPLLAKHWSGYGSGQKFKADANGFIDFGS